MSDSHSQGHFETRAIHAGQGPDPVTGAVMTPVYMTSTYAQTSPGNPIGGYEYSRTHNPTRTALQDNLASLENGKYGLCFSSGLAATNALLDTLKPGDKVVAANDLYGGTYRIFTKVFERYGIEFQFVDSTDLSQVEAAMDANTRYVYIETPTNPLLHLTDIA
ncbi:MAG: PLP-dependent transferase, partial [Planctomycetes bacterium]|nr:PLP-dependent transferase [Planctomycetota bacterium]